MVKVKKTIAIDRTLPKGFQPGLYDIIIGKGKCYQNIGNNNFLTLVALKLHKYSAASSKRQKSKIVTSIVSEINKRSPHGGFIKMNSNGVWYQITKNAVRERISQSFRDALQESYKSSIASRKVARKRKQRTPEMKYMSALCQSKQSKQLVNEKNYVSVSESCRYILDSEPSSSDSESEFLHKRNNIEVFDDELLDQIYTPYKVDLDLHDFEMEKIDGTSPTQVEDENDFDLMSTCSSFVDDNYEEKDEFEVLSLDDINLNTAPLFENEDCVDTMSTCSSFADGNKNQENDEFDMYPIDKIDSKNVLLYEDKMINTETSQHCDSYVPSARTNANSQTFSDDMNLLNIAHNRKTNDRNGFKCTPNCNTRVAMTV